MKIKPIAKYVGYKKHLPEGVWQNELDYIVWVDESSGYKCEVYRQDVGHLCGYVHLPEGHSLYNLDIVDVDQPDIDVHGGITFSHDGQIGFDCAHSQDIAPLSPLKFDYGTYKDVSYVIKETEKLAKQLKKFEK